jgi:hypothetical protein
MLISLGKCFSALINMGCGGSKQIHSVKTPVVISSVPNEQTAKAEATHTAAPPLASKAEVKEHPATRDEANRIAGPVTPSSVQKANVPEVATKPPIEVLKANAAHVDTPLVYIEPNKPQVGGVSTSYAYYVEKKPIDFDIKKTKVPEFDEVFDEAVLPFAILKQAYETLNDAISRFETEAQGEMLEDPTTEDLITIMLYCFSASSNGDFAKLEFRSSYKAPFFHVKRDCLNPRHWPLVDAWEYFASEVDADQTKLRPLTSIINKTLDRASEFRDTGNINIDKANLSDMDVPRAAINFALNYDSLSKAPKLLEDTIDRCKSKFTCIANIVHKLTDQAEVERIKDVGVLAHSRQCLEVQDLVKLCWPTLKQGKSGR